MSCVMLNLAYRNLSLPYQKKDVHIMKAMKTALRMYCIVRDRVPEINVLCIFNSLYD